MYLLFLHVTPYTTTKFFSLKKKKRRNDRRTLVLFSSELSIVSLESVQFLCFFFFIDNSSIRSETPKLRYTYTVIERNEKKIIFTAQLIVIYE